MKKLYLIVGSDVEIIECNNVDYLVKQLKKRRAEEENLPSCSRALIIEGERSYLSKGEPKYLLIGDKKIPIFGEDEIAPDEDGYLITPPKTHRPDPPRDDDDDDYPGHAYDPADPRSPF